MKSEVDQFEDAGFLILDEVVSEAERSQIERQLSEVILVGAGTRNLLLAHWCSQLAIDLKCRQPIATLLPRDPIAVQCTYFEKSPDRNWLVSLHRDLSIPVKSRFDAPGWSGWSEKEGIFYVQPPKSVLETLVAVRLHLEDNTAMNGPLQVVPGSHANFTAGNSRVACVVRKCGAVVIRPLILHASSKLVAGSRRVLHFLYGPPYLPDNAQWAHAV
jgi:Phytanoyl-CoA dioxygenase (PhyH)